MLDVASSRQVSLGAPLALSVMPVSRFSAISLLVDLYLDS